MSVYLLIVCYAYFMKQLRIRNAGRSCKYSFMLVFFMDLLSNLVVRIEEGADCDYLDTVPPNICCDVRLVWLDMVTLLVNPGFTAASTDKTN